MRRRSYLCEVIQVLLSAAVIVLTVVLFFRADQLSVLFPVVFGLAAVLSLFYAFEGVLYNRDRVVKKGRLAAFILIGLVLAFITVIAARTVL
ncbi:MAG: hypothetical protein IJM76_03980 [Lachnospiraceae bacterium]|nr:hypothetical protein [Lachnospiraceae bacterium]